MKVKVLVLTGDGINCEVELARSFNLCGGEAQIMHINDFIGNVQCLKNFQILALPGGFSYADELGSGKIMALKLEKYAKRELGEFISQGRPVIGICNGVQMLTMLGVFDEADYKVRLATNNHARFLNKWEQLKSEQNDCLWTKDIQSLFLPIRHAQGRFVSNCDEEKTIELLKRDKKIALTYQSNPNGSIGSIAGLCNTQGNVFGLMPHPEAAINSMLYPGGEVVGTVGLEIFNNSIKYIKSNF